MLTIVTEDEEHLEDFQRVHAMRLLLDTHAFRLIIAQAMTEQIPVISGTAAFGAYPVTRIW